MRFAVASFLGSLLLAPVAGAAPLDWRAVDVDPRRPLRPRPTSAGSSPRDRSRPRSTSTGDGKKDVQDAFALVTLPHAPGPHRRSRRQQGGLRSGAAARGPRGVGGGCGPGGRDDRARRGQGPRAGRPGAEAGGLLRGRAGRALRWTSEPRSTTKRARRPSPCTTSTRPASASPRRPRSPPRRDSALANLGFVLAEEGRYHPDALVLLARARQFQPRSCTTLNNLAFVMARAGSPGGRAPVLRRGRRPLPAGRDAPPQPRGGAAPGRAVRRPLRASFEQALRLNRARCGRLPHGRRHGPSRPALVHGGAGRGLRAASRPGVGVARRGATWTPFMQVEEVLGMARDKAMEGAAGGHPGAQAAVRRPRQDHPPRPPWPRAAAPARISRAASPTASRSCAPWRRSAGTRGAR